MNDLNHRSWTEFKEEIQKYIPLHRSFFSRHKDDRCSALFRGQSNSEWELQTTLERTPCSDTTLERYIRSCHSARRFIENFEPSGISYEENVDLSKFDLSVKLPNYEYLAYLRHHGFPSPLLDWTESPYIAAFFAFRDIPKESTKSVRIHVYEADLGEGRAYVGSQPHILSMGPFAKIHSRHTIQQCWYTICIKEQYSGDAEHRSRETIFCSYEEAFSLSQQIQANQDGYSFFDIDIKYRNEALADLYHMNIHAYSLLGTTDSLMEMASPRIFNLPPDSDS